MSIFKKLKGKTYNFNDIEKILDEIERISLLENYEFIDANTIEKIRDDKIDFVFQVEESEKIYVKQINIFGNTITTEKFIRNNLIVDEGDTLNKIPRINLQITLNQKISLDQLNMKLWILKIVI